jgi:ABC-type lipoprotein export system ATPase subunit
LGVDGEADAAARCVGVAVRYPSGSGEVDALRDVTVAFGRGRLSVVAGPSGSGKSSLLRTLAGLQPVHSGTVVVDGVDIGRLSGRAMRRLRRRSIGFVLEEPAANLLGYLRADEQVMLAARLRGTGSAAASAEIAELLAALGLADHAHAPPEELSGGQQQRLAFAAAAVGRPALLLADEPTATLDTASGVLLIDTLRALVAAGRTLVVSSHDPAVIAAADTVIHLRDGHPLDVAHGPHRAHGSDPSDGIDGPERVHGPDGPDRPDLDSEPAEIDVVDQVPGPNRPDVSDRADMVDEIDRVHGSDRSDGDGEIDVVDGSDGVDI